jgi:hypothetical protein
MRMAGMDVRTEVRHLLSNGTEDRPADILLTTQTGSYEVRTCFDFSLTGYDKSLQAVDDRKYRTYLDQCRRDNLKFVPLAANSLGLLSPTFEKWIKNIGRETVIRNDEGDEDQVNHSLFTTLQYHIITKTAHLMRSIAVGEITKDSTGKTYSGCHGFPVISHAALY